MAALVAPGAPVSVLIEYGLAEGVVEKLVEAGVGAIEKLGSMTPEELEAIPGIDQESVDQLQMAVNSYYSQFEEQGQAAAAPEAAAEPGAEAAEAGAEAGGEPPEALQAAPEAEIAEQSGTMEDAGSPTQNLESAVIPEEAGSQGDAPEGE